MKSEPYSKFLARLVASLILVPLLAISVLADAGDTTRVSVASDGMQGNSGSNYFVPGGYYGNFILMMVV